MSGALLLYIIIVVSVLKGVHFLRPRAHPESGHCRVTVSAVRPPELRWVVPSSLGSTLE